MLKWLALAFSLPFAASAASPEELESLRASLATGEMMAILSEEGIAQSEDLREEMFPGRGGVAWRAVLDGVYATDRLEALFDEAFDAALDGEDVAPLLDFYGSELGARIASLEVQARRAIMSEDVEAAARNAWDALRDDGSPRVALLEEFERINELVERNVTGALNANLGFYQGLATGPGFDLSEDQILADVWGQEPQIREDTEGWIFGYMTLAYDGLSDEALRSYIEMSASEAGRDLNRALFAGFEAVFTDVSRALGAATARFSVGDEL